MKTRIISPAVFLIVFVICVVFGHDVIESWFSFLAGAVFALAVRDVGRVLLK